MLYIVNNLVCFQNVEPSRLFEWVDGPLIEAMHKGDLFLADEISLADDSVLERLNSLLGMCIPHVVTLR